MLTDAQIEYFAEISFMRGVLAERMGLIGNPRGLIADRDFDALVESLRTLEIIEDGLCAMAGRYNRED
jgi:hypothetical protein